MFKTVVLIILIATLAGAAFGYGEHFDCHPPDRHFIGDVPFTSQLPNFCGPASLSSLLAYWGVTTSQEAIGKSTYDPQVSGTNGAELLMYCRESGLSAYSFNGTLPQVKALVSKGYPVIVIQDLSREDTTGHYRVVVGYSDAKQTITLRDGMQSAYVVIKYSEFDQLWKRRGRWALLAMPLKKDLYRDTLGKANTVLHMDLAQAYLHKGDMKRAEAECIEALRLEPTNPYAKKFLAEARGVSKT